MAALVSEAITFHIRMERTVGWVAYLPLLCYFGNLAETLVYQEEKALYMGASINAFKSSKPIRSNLIPTPWHQQPVNVIPVTTAVRLKQE